MFHCPLFQQVTGTSTYQNSLCYLNSRSVRLQLDKPDILENRYNTLHCMGMQLITVLYHLCSPSHLCNCTKQTLIILYVKTYQVLSKLFKGQGCQLNFLPTQSQYKYSNTSLCVEYKILKCYQMKKLTKNNTEQKQK